MHTESVNLGNLFSYLQGIAESLQKITRWDLRAKIGGQTTVENDLQHSFKTAFFAIHCAVLENELQESDRQLDIGLLATMALVHDIAETVIGDIVGFAKTSADGEKEFVAFSQIVAPLPPSVRDYFLTAFRHANRGTEHSLESRESRFFHAVEALGYVKRALHECKAGNLHFAPLLFVRQIPVLLDLAEEFPSIGRQVAPFIADARNYSEEFQKRRAEYLAAHIKAGGAEETFSF